MCGLSNKFKKNVKKSDHFDKVLIRGNKMPVRKVDRRVRKTKKQLREALTTLLKEKPIQKIRVREIADLIDINRGTFYQYYRDVYDMLSKIENELFEQFNQVMEETGIQNNRDGKTDIKPLFVKIISLLKENADLAIALMGPNGDPVFVERVKGLVRKRCMDDWMGRYQTPESLQYFEYYYAFVVSGCIGLFQRWLENGADEAPERLAVLFEQIILKGVQIFEE